MGGEGKIPFWLPIVHLTIILVPLIIRCEGIECFGENVNLGSLKLYNTTNPSYHETGASTRALYDHRLEHNVKLIESDYARAKFNKKCEEYILRMMIIL